MLSRRHFLTGLGAAGFTGPFLARPGFAQGPMPIENTPPNLDDEALERAFLDNSEPLEGGYVVKGLGGNQYGSWPFWWELDPPEMADWPPDSRTVDYAHLPARDAGESFPLSDAALRRIVASHAYRPLSNRFVLFGIRGARCADEAAAARFGSAIDLVEVHPDHFDHRCLLGVWDTRARTVWATPASTTPHVAYLYAQREASTFSNEANMLPTGMYRYRVGTHRNGTSSFQPGAFRPDNPAFAVLRCVEEGPITMSRDQFWDTRDTNHGDNIHAGTYSTRADRPKYWSAGCQVIPGYYSDGNKVPQGEWARFRMAAGLKRTPELTRHERIEDDRFNVETSEDGRRYSYVLTTGRDVRLAGENAAVAALRFGSTGPKVRELQAALGLPTGERDGIFGLGVQKALLTSGKTTAPIVDAKLANALGFNL